jgi:hypothetical protein
MEKHIMKPKFKNISLAIAALFAAQLSADVASAAPPLSVLGTWNIQANQTSGQLTVTFQGSAGTCRALGGTAFGQTMTGVYCPSTGRIQFLRLNSILRAAQVFTGNVGDAVGGLPLRMAGTFFVQHPVSGFFGEYNFDASLTDHSQEVSSEAAINHVDQIGQGGNFLVTYFFSDSERTNLIGRCQTASPCTVAYCEGDTSRYREFEASSCDEPEPEPGPCDTLRPPPGC